MITSDEIVFKNLRAMVDLCRKEDTRPLDDVSRRLPRKVKQVGRWHAKK